MNVKNTPDTQEAGPVPTTEQPLPQATPEITDRDKEITISVENHNTSVYWLILVASVALLIVMPEQAKWIETKRGWFTQPMVGSTLGLSIMVIFAAWRAVFSFNPQACTPANILESFFDSLGRYRVAIITSALFFLYVNTLSLIGFVPATLALVTLLLWLSRLLDRFWFTTTLFTLFVIVVIFRVGLTLWLPDVWLYEFLPTEWADLANQYL